MGGTLRSPGQFCSLGVPSAAKILPSWSTSVPPGNQGRRNNSSASTQDERARHSAAALSMRLKASLLSKKCYG